MAEVDFEDQVTEEHSRPEKKKKGITKQELATRNSTPKNTSNKKRKEKKKMLDSLQSTINDIGEEKETVRKKKKQYKIDPTDSRNC